MKYKYKPIEQAQVGDIVEARDTCNVKTGELHQITDVTKEGIYISSVNDYIWDFKYGARDWKLIETLPGEEAKVGDTIVRTTIKSDYDYNKQHTIGKIEYVDRINSIGNVRIFSSTMSIHPEDFRVICKEAITTNTFKVGDIVRRIANENATCPINSEHTVRRITGGIVYYTDSLASYYFNFELVKSANQEPLLPRQTKEYFDAFQIAYEAGVELVYTNVDRDDYWIKTKEEYIPSYIWTTWKESIQEKFPCRFKQANLPKGCPSDQFSNKYWAFWENLSKTKELECFAYGTARWTPVTTVKNLKQVYYSKDNKPRLFRIKANSSKNGQFSEPQDAQAEPTQIIKENTMQEKVTIEIDANILRQVDPQPEAAKTALERTTSTVLIVYDQNGNVFDMKTEATAADVKSAKANLQKPECLGFTIRIYKFKKGFTTSIPVVETKD